MWDRGDNAPRAQLRVRRTSFSRRIDGDLSIFVPLGTTGTLLDMEGGRCCVVWDAAFACDTRQRGDAARCIIQGFYDKETMPGELEFVEVAQLAA